MSTRRPLTKREQRARRWRVVVALLLGAAINVLVAWTCVLTVGGEQPQSLNWSATDYGLQWVQVPPPARVPEDWPNSAWEGEISNGFGWRSERFSQRPVPTYGNPPGPEYIHYTYRAGWPLLSLRATMILERESGQHKPWILQQYSDRPVSLYTMGYPVHRLPDFMIRSGKNSDAWWARSHRSFGYRRIPLVPMPLGFVVNTLVYALVAWCALTLLAARKIRRRVRKGKCHVCTYKRDGLARETPCPECGAVAPHERQHHRARARCSSGETSPLTRRTMTP